MPFNHFSFHSHCCFSWSRQELPSPEISTGDRGDLPKDGNLQEWGSCRCLSEPAGVCFKSQASWECSSSGIRNTQEEKISHACCQNSNSTPTMLSSEMNSNLLQKINLVLHGSRLPTAWWHCQGNPSDVQKIRSPEKTVNIWLLEETASKQIEGTCSTFPLVAFWNLFFF